MSKSTDPVLLEIQTNATAAAMKYADKIERIHGLLEQASAVWATLDIRSRDALTAFHADDASLAACLRWGEQAACDLFALTKVK